MKLTLATFQQEALKNLRDNCTVQQLYLDSMLKQ